MTSHSKLADKKFVLRTPPDLWEKVCSIAERENRSLNNMLQELIKKGYREILSGKSDP